MAIGSAKADPGSSKDPFPTWSAIRRSVAKADPGSSKDPSEFLEVLVEALDQVLHRWSPADARYPIGEAAYSLP